MLKSEEVGGGEGCKVSFSHSVVKQRNSRPLANGSDSVLCFKSIHRSCVLYPQKPCGGGGDRRNNFGFYLDFEVQSLSSEVRPFKPIVNAS